MLGAVLSPAQTLSTRRTNDIAHAHDITRSGSKQSGTLGQLPT